MTEIPDAFEQALAVAADPGEATGPVELALATAAQSKAAGSVDRGEVHPGARELLVAALGQVVAAARVSAGRGMPPPDRFVMLLRWLRTTLSSWSAEADPTRAQLSGALFVLASATIDTEALLRAWPAVGANTTLLEELAASVSGLKAEYGDLEAPGMPLWEREFAQGFIAADAARDWASLAQAWPRLEAGSRMAPELAATVDLLAAADLPRLGGALRDVGQTSVAMQVMGALPAHGRLVAAVHSGNPVVAFAALHQTFHRTDQAASVGEVRASAERLLLDAARDGVLWRGWMAVFGRNPAAYGHFQLSLGQALADASEGAVAAYVEALTLEVRDSPDAPGRMAVAACLKAFRERADATRRKFLWRLAFERWSAWRFGTSDRAALFGLRWSDLDYAICQCVLECMDEPERAEREGAILEALTTIGDSWYASKVHMTTEWFRRISELQPYANARAVHAGHHRPDDIGYAYLPSSVEANAYVISMFGHVGRSVSPMASPPP